MQVISIGRDATNDRVLNDNLVSRHHAQLTIAGNGRVMIRDLGSSNGTFVNGNRITESYLDAGDVVKCGQTLLNWTSWVGDIGSAGLNDSQPAMNLLNFHSLTPLSNEMGILNLRGNHIEINLTTHRVCLKEDEWFRSYSIDIFLEDISSIESVFRSKLIFLLLGILGILGFVYELSNDASNEAWAILVLALIFLIIWFLSRQHLVCICSDGGHPLKVIIYKRFGIAAEDFIDKLQLAKAERVANLYQARR